MDLLDAFWWYQRKQTGLGHAFRDNVELVLDKLAQNPMVHPLVYLTVRRAFIRCFPFGIFYILQDNTIIVLAVLHARRDPVNWKDRL